MPKLLQVSKVAEKQILAIVRSVSEYTGSPVSGMKLYDQLEEKFTYLCLFPKSGKRLDERTRQVFCRHYRIVYREYDDRVEIITVIHSRRKYPQDE